MSDTRPHSTVDTCFAHHPPSDLQAPGDRSAPGSINFFQQFSSAITAGSHASSTSNCTTLTAAIKTFTDAFVAELAKNTSPSGRRSGSPDNMVDLPRSFASAFAASDARGGVIAIHWGATDLVVPSSSSTSSGASSGTVAVTFDVHATTVWGENIYITGSVGALKNWSPKNALLLSAAKYPTWSITINLPANTPIQYKYIRKYKGATTWEKDPNKRITTPSGDTCIVKDSWRGRR
ncbi:glycoside hydrolase family 15 protein [Heterobasidion irregulare TC 32-1]|uniref:Glycoside hydrolase family 15 protein n=1 Tax=Heterobasidion irregulare (strain TC 32-1) TaxID=747525 RepID=W4JNY4_HETIT|nr:glycoside hydrolase family 15 protein [Heterobasidion irregulare TC 32-1]ETW75199.1 glycoside hydrolase family 15 protein [Heterobasidion irregulare TC 32-1]